MRSRRFEWFLAAAFALLWSSVWLWQNPGVLMGPVSAAERDAYLERIQALPAPPEERAAISRQLRSWLEADDGRPFYMLNLMRYHNQLRLLAGWPEFDGTPEQSNKHYEDAVMPLLFAQGGYPRYASTAQGGNLMGPSGPDEGWDRILLVRYPSRRAFMDLITDPHYQPMLPYKLMALSVTLAPTSAELQVPEVPMALGTALLVLWLVFAWRRSARRARSARLH